MYAVNDNDIIGKEGESVSRHLSSTSFSYVNKPS